MKEFYDRNSDFKQYVDRYAKKHNEGNSISVDEALEHDIVKQVASQYKENEEARVEQSITNNIQYRHGSCDFGREKDSNEAVS